MNRSRYASIGSVLIAAFTTPTLADFSTLTYYLQSSTSAGSNPSKTQYISGSTLPNSLSTSSTNSDPQYGSAGNNYFGAISSGRLAGASTSSSTSKGYGPPASAGDYNLDFTITSPQSYFLTGYISFSGPLGAPRSTEFILSDQNNTRYVDVDYGMSQAGSTNLSSSGVLQPGTYYVRASAFTQPSVGSANAQLQFSFQINSSSTPIGSSQSVPIAPSGDLSQNAPASVSTSASKAVAYGSAASAVSASSISKFFSVPTGKWFAPAVSSQLEFDTTDSTGFAQILSLPVGLDADDKFNIVINGSSIGTFSGGSKVDFVALLGHSVSSFTIAGIDAANIDSFPVQLGFDAAQSSFQVTSIPEPVGFFAAGTALASVLRRRRVSA